MEEKAKSRAERAAEYFRMGYNCCQSVALAFADKFGENSEQGVAALASGFGGGFARQREVCGCVSGMTLVAGAVLPADPENMESRTRNYAFVQKLCAEFREAQGSIICRELLGIRKEAAPEPPKPSERTPAYYHSRRCEDYVACAAAILEKNLL